MTPPRARDAGFSLIEVLVALAVVALMTAVLFETLTRNVRFAQDLGRRREAVLLAQSLLAETGVPPPGTGLQDEGRRGVLVWRIERRTQPGSARDGRPPLQDVRIDVRDADTGRMLTSVATLRLVR
jgi:general secretion pathway protein I